MDCSLPGSSAHGILQARIQEWVTMPFSRGSFWLRDWTRVSRVVDRRFAIWATREVHGQRYMFIFIINHSNNLQCILYSFISSILFLFDWNNLIVMNDLKRLPFLSFYKLEIQGFLHLLSDWGYRDTVRWKREEREGGGRKGEREEREGERERERW